MKGFHFSLEPVVTFRRFQKKREAQKLAQAAREAAQAGELSREAREALEKMDHQAVTGASGQIRAAAALQNRQQLAELQSQAEQAQARWQKSLEAQDHARESAKQAWRAEKILEKLRQRERARFLLRLEKLDELTANDFVNARQNQPKRESEL